MKLLHLLIVSAACAGFARAEPTLYLQLTTHNEQPHIPDTPNFTNFTAQADYVRWRNALKEFGEMCVARGLRYNCQCEWNFLEGVLKWEVRPATAIPGITTNTGNLNILAYLHQLGQTAGVPIELDPHSHEGGGYSYADVAHLLYQCGVTPAPVVGGHILDDITWVSRDFDRLSAVTGVVATKYATATNWFPALLMGGGTASHVNDPHDSGFWRPASASNFFTHATNGPLVAIGSWQNDLHETSRLIERLESGEVPAGGRLWTSGLVLNHRDLQDAAYRTNEARMILDTLKRWQDEGRIQTTTYMESLGLWQTNFLEAASLYQRPEDNVSFSLNWQDYFYTNESMAYLEALLDLHESNQVPMDVFFTTWQTDIIEQNPALLGRLQSSALVVQSYHVRPPKPYASNFTWGSITNPATDKNALILNYETHGVDLTNGSATANSGGYGKLSALQAYAPVCVGALAPASVATNVYGVFSNLGARMFVQHSPPVNLNTLETVTRLPFRPEHRDWKLIGVWNPNPGDPQPTSLTQALVEAHNTSTNGGHAPWFVGIKLHDNDLFAEQSWWTLVYSNAWSRPWNPNQYAPALSASEQSNRLAFYVNQVEEVASRRAQLNLLNSWDTIAFMGDARPRPVGLSRTAQAENQPAGTVLARISGGGGVAGQALRYRLVAGAGDTHNSDFSVVSNQLLSATILDYESGATRQFRLRWEWVDALDGATVLAQDERALTLVLRNVDSDDDDGDGMTEAEESTAGTDPQDSNSVLRVSTSAWGVGPDAFQVGVFGVTNHLYDLECSSNLLDWVTATGAGATNQLGADALLSLVNSNLAHHGQFYRIRVSLPTGAGP